MKLLAPLAAHSPGLRLAFALEIEHHSGADERLHRQHTVAADNRDYHHLSQTEIDGE
jgi:hypothetical protein